jgi:hypothetical protein
MPKRSNIDGAEATIGYARLRDKLNDAPALESRFVRIVRAYASNLTGTGLVPPPQGHGIIKAIVIMLCALAAIGWLA